MFPWNKVKEMNKLQQTHLSMPMFHFQISMDIAEIW
jgi:hypothetical protein